MKLHNMVPLTLQPPFDSLYRQAQAILDANDSEFEFDSQKSTEQIFAELIVDQCLVEVDKWTGTKFTPATNIIKHNIKTMFKL